MNATPSPEKPERPDPTEGVGHDDTTRIEDPGTQLFRPDFTPRLPQAVGDFRLSPGWEPVPGYVLGHRLGSGGFGEVWQAVGPGGVTLAIKFINLDGGLGAGEIRALDLLKNIHHPHLIGISGVWRTDDLLIIAMELADGTLNDALDQAQIEGEVGIDPDLLVEYFREAAKGIDHLNALGIIHHDIKPRNLLLMSGGVKVADFGLARSTEPSPEQSRLQMTPSYASPELCRGEACDRTDQYALAVSYCELRGGRLPFEGNQWQVITGHLQGEPDLNMIPAVERPVVARALEKNPIQRWADCRSFVGALVGARSSPLPDETDESSSEVATAPWVPDPPRIQTTRRGFAVAIGSTGLLAAAAASSAAWVRLASRDPLEEIRRVEILRDLGFIRRQPYAEIRDFSPGHVEVDRIEPNANTAFEILGDERVVDLRGWKDVPDDQLNELVSAVTQVRNVSLRKVQPATTLRFPGRTSGLALFSRCLSHYPFHEVAQKTNAFTGSDRMKVREIVIDVSPIEVGEDFKVQVTTTYWNSLQTPGELWLGVIGYGTASKVSLLILFPDGKPFKEYKLQTTRAARAKDTPYSGPRTVLTGVANDWINWDILKPESGLVYQIYWDW